METDVKIGLAKPNTPLQSGRQKLPTASHVSLPDENHN
jgi:hypothetical protein